MKDKEASGTILRGENHPHAKLTIAEVREIRHMIGKGFIQRIIAKYFKVDQRTISGIKTGTKWSHVH